MPDFTEIASGLRFPEGPIALPDGSVLLTEIERHTRTRVARDGSVDVVANSSPPGIPRSLPDSDTGFLILPLYLRSQQPEAVRRR